MCQRPFPAAGPLRAAFTLVELLVVIAIIGILAALLVPTYGRVRINTQMKMAQSEESLLVGAIEQYYATYSRLPASSNAVAAVAGTTNDFTFGSANGSAGALSGMPINPATGAAFSITTLGESAATWQNNNSELMAILGDDNFWPEFTNNSGHIYNSRQTPFFQPKAATAPATSGAAPGPPGLGSDEVWRDPWGLPYMVTLDLNYNDHAFDPYLNQMYMNQFSGSTGLNPPGHAVVWSFGPFKRIDLRLGLNNNSTNKYFVKSF